MSNDDLQYSKYGVFNIKMQLKSLASINFHGFYNFKNQSNKIFISLFFKPTKYKVISEQVPYNFAENIAVKRLGTLLVDIQNYDIHNYRYLVLFNINSL